MALVPSGRTRIMQKQVFKETMFEAFAQQAPQQTGTQPSPKPDPRLQVEQQQIGGEQPVGTQPPQAVATPEQPPTEAPVGMPGEETPDPNMTAEDGTKPNEAEGGESDIKDAWKEMLTGIGVPPRLLDNLDKQLYSEETDLASNTIKGHYIIPTYTSKDKITKQKALMLARKMEQKFGLTSRMRLEDRNWRIDFQTRPKVDLQQGGTSFDHIMQGKQNKAASAMTMGEMITSRREELFNTMRGIMRKG